MKSILITALALAPLALADISLGSSAAPAAAAATPEDQAYITMAKDIIQAVNDLSTVLDGVKDQASADAAAPQVSKLAARMIELQKKAEAMPSPGANTEQQVRASMNMAEVQQIVSRFLNSFIRIGMNMGYGSQALLDALSPVQNALPGKEE